MSSGNSDGALFVWLIMAGVMTVKCFFSFFSRLKLYRYIANTPRSRIASAAQGYVELHGKAKQLGEKPLLSPIFQNPCLWYKVLIEKEKRNSKGEKSWDTEVAYSSSALFIIEDETGQCVISPLALEINSINKKEIIEQSPDYPLVKQVGISGRLRMTEWLITENAPLYALGFLETYYQNSTPFERALYKKALKKHQRSATYSMFRRSLFEAKFADENTLTYLQWKAAFHNSKASDGINFLSKKMRPGLISNIKETRLIKKYKRSIILNGIGFVAFGGFTVFLAASRFM